MTDSFVVHHTREAHPDTSLPDTHQDSFSRTILGFWVYLMTDCVLFATLFVTYAVLHPNTFGGPSSKELFSLTTAFVETMILLASSVTCGLGMLTLVNEQKQKAFQWFLATIVLGLVFVGIELVEFSHLVAEGNSWTRSAFLSSFFTLVGTHGLHVSIGLLWLVVMLFQLNYYGITIHTFRRFVTFSLFWHFLDLIWIFIFTYVYLMGVI
jgi:cytochrome o ubiquinol oxidase, subunit III